MRIGIVVAEFNAVITDKLLAGAERGLQEQQIDYEVFQVPGALEIPLLCAELAETGHYQGLIALGVVIQGETDHYTMVCRGSLDGVLEVQLRYHLPIAFEVLMVANARLALERAGDRADNNKGYQAAYHVVSMVKLLPSIRKPSKRHRG